ncbi:MAG: PstS family phosphate ABC transporter substrate-binding protein [Jiangellaceae bacterium]|nr:PstS family phosphate ABC transporter substrate-binding protein [Jiangellaceae bacterium]
MTSFRSSYRRRAVLGAATAGAFLAIAACGSGNDPQNVTAEGETEQGLSGEVVVDGSSTVFPLTSAAAELFTAENPEVQVTVGQSGTGGGFEKFCAGETDVSDASRPIENDEAAACQQNGIGYDEFSIANDALSVIVSKDNDWATCLTVDQLNAIWAPNSTVSSWKQVDPAFPDEPLTLAGPGTDSGTFDYFTDAVNGEEGASRTDYQASEDDNVIVRAVSGSRGALGYLGYSYYEQNTHALQALEIDGGSGCVAPSPEAVQDASYAPLGRQLFIYPSAKSLERPEVQGFVSFYVENIDEIVEAAGFIALNDEQKAELREQFDSLLGGSSTP